MGVALIPTFIIAEQLRTGQLVNLLDTHCCEDHSVYALYPASRYLSPKVRAFIDFAAIACAGPAYRPDGGAGKGFEETAMASISNDTPSV